jgi:hypothetical protein
MTENKYSRGKIYKIVSDSCDEIYIGSTCEPTLARRLAKHRGHYNEYKNGTRNKCMSSFQLLERGDFSIVLIKEYPCENKEQLFAKERYYIDKYKDVCINKMKNVGITLTLGRNEYYKQYRSGFSPERKLKISMQKKKYNQENSDTIKAHANQKMKCKSCGSIYTRCHKQRHRRTQKHQNALENVQ